MAVAATVNCWSLPCKFNSLSLTASSHSSPPNSTSFKPLSFSANVSPNFNFFSKGFVSLRPVQKPLRHSIVCEAAPTKKPDSAKKRERQNEKRRLYNKSRKSEIKTRMKKVLKSLDVLRKKKDAKPEEVITIEKLIAEAYSVIDKAVQVGTLHRNTGANRKSRLARRKKAIEIHHGWYTPSPPTTV